jgi:hypothetical protein
MRPQPADKDWTPHALAPSRSNGYHRTDSEGDQNVFEVEMSRVWPIIVQFGIGGLLCLIGLWGGFKGGYMHLRFSQDRKMLVVIGGGFLALLILSCIFTFWLPFAGEEVAP